MKALVVEDEGRDAQKEGQRSEKRHHVPVPGVCQSNRYEVEPEQRCNYVLQAANDVKRSVFGVGATVVVIEVNEYVHYSQHAAKHHRVNPLGYGQRRMRRLLTITTEILYSSRLDANPDGHS